VRKDRDSWFVGGYQQERPNETRYSADALRTAFEAYVENVEDALSEFGLPDLEAVRRATYAS
jgi:hypothetical protein